MIALEKIELCQSEGLIINCISLMSTDNDAAATMLQLAL